MPRGSGCGPGSCARARSGPPATRCRSRTAGCPRVRSAPASGWPPPALSTSLPRCRAPPGTSSGPGPARRDRARQATWIALADGNKDQIARIQAEAAARGITVTITCDLIHLSEHLQDAAWCLFPQASPDAGPWVRDRIAAIMDGGPAGAAVAAAGRRTAAARLGKDVRTTIEKTAAYLEAKAPCLDYPAALRDGWPIAAGVIEGACRYLVKDRMDITGARWGTETADAILKLRAITANGDFDAYRHWHLDREHERNHPPNHALAA